MKSGRRKPEIWNVEDQIRHHNEHYAEYSPFLVAAANGWLDELKTILNGISDYEEKRKFVNQSGGWNGSTALTLAAYAGHTTIVEFVLSSAKVDTNILTTAGDSALILASAAGHGDIVSLLLDHGSDVEIANKTGKTAVLAATERGHLDVLQKLCGETVQTSTRWNRLVKRNSLDKNCPLLACELGHADIVRWLLSVDGKLLNEVTVSGYFAVL